MINSKYTAIIICCIVLCSASVTKADCIGDDLEGLHTYISNWLRNSCIGPSWCEGSDYDLDGKVDLIDYGSLFGSLPELFLVENGVGRVSIHNVGTSSSVVNYAAQQLQAAFQAACNITPQINPSTAAPIKISIGVAGTNRFNNVGVGSSHEQAYAVRRRNNNIELVGNSAAAVMWAVEDFCREVLHVSRPIANDIISCGREVQPKISVGRLCKVEAPDFAYRGWIIGENVDGVHYNNLIGNWMSHNRQNTLHTYLQYLGDTINGSSTYNKMLSRGIDADTTIHNFGWYVPADVYYDSHPEYFPLINGVRVRPPNSGIIGIQLCLSNPEVFKIVKDKLIQSFSAFPRTKVFGIAPNDGPGGWCECENCRVWDGSQAGSGIMSNRLIHFVNSIADYLGPSYPGKFIGTSAYQETRQPPTIDVSNNVAITFGTGGRNYMKKLTDPCDTYNAAIMTPLMGWLAKSQNVHFWEYYYFLNDYDWACMDFCPTPYARTICEEFKELKTLGLAGVCGETMSYFWPGQRLLCYAVAQAGWNTSTDFNDILNNFCREAYGPAAPYMKAYHLFYESKLYEHVPVLLFYGDSEQLFTKAFTSADYNLMDSYLSSALSAAQTSGSQAHIIAVSEAVNMAQKFRTYPACVNGIGPNLVANPGAENGSNSWSTDVFGGVGDYSFSIANTAYSGTNSFKIECQGQTGLVARWYQLNLPLETGKKYAASFWVKSQAGAYGKIEMWQGSQRVYASWADSNGQWTRHVVPKISATASTMHIYLGTSGPGTVFFDDIFIAKLPE